MPTGATHCYSQLRLSDKGRATKGLVVCYEVWLGLMGWVFGQAQRVWSGPLLCSFSFSF